MSIDPLPAAQEPLALTVRASDVAQAAFDFSGPASSPDLPEPPPTGVYRAVLLARRARSIRSRPFHWADQQRNIRRDRLAMCLDRSAISELARVAPTSRADGLLMLDGWRAAYDSGQTIRLVADFCVSDCRAFDPTI